MHNFPFLPTRSCMSEAWRSALVNQGFLRQQDPIRPRWRPKGQLWGRARGIQAPCWTPEETTDPVREKVQRAEPKGKKDLCEDAVMPLLTSTHPRDGLTHTSFNNLSSERTRTHISLSVSLHRSFRGGATRGCWWKVAQAHGMRSGLHICRKDETGLPILQWWCQPAYMTVCGWGAKFLRFPFVFSFQFFLLLSFLFLVISLPTSFFGHYSFCSQKKQSCICYFMCTWDIITVLHMGEMRAGNF